jgi:hypothetical protein
MDVPRSGERGNERAGSSVDLGKRPISPAAVRAGSLRHVTEDIYRPVMCPYCDAAVKLTDDECWLCYRFLAPGCFDDQR